MATANLAPTPSRNLAKPKPSLCLTRRDKYEGRQKKDQERQRRCSWSFFCLLYPTATGVGVSVEEDNLNMTLCARILAGKRSSKALMSLIWRCSHTSRSWFSTQSLV